VVTALARSSTERTARCGQTWRDSAVGVKRGHSHFPWITRKAYESGAPSHLVPYRAKRPSYRSFLYRKRGLSSGFDFCVSSSLVAQWIACQTTTLMAQCLSRGERRLFFHINKYAFKFTLMPGPFTDL